MMFLKKIAFAIITLGIIIGSFLTVSAASWKSYLGLNAGWYEGTEGKVTKNTASAWTVKVQSIGWGGCYGGQMSKKISIKKGTRYTLKFTLKSSNLDKWVWVKIGNETGSKMVFGKWVDCKKGKSVTVIEEFMAKYNSDTITFGFGGDFYDRQGVTTDKDAKVRYKYAPNKKLDGRLPSDYSAEHPTVLTCKGFSLKSEHSSKPQLNYKKVTLRVGKSIKLNILNKSGKVRWKSSKKSVATVSKKGKVKARHKGKTTITAIVGSKKYKCKVTVKKKKKSSNYNIIMPKDFKYFSVRFHITDYNFVENIMYITFWCDSCDYNDDSFFCKAICKNANGKVIDIISTCGIVSYTSLYNTYYYGYIEIPKETQTIEFINY